MFDLIKRENKIFDILQEFVDAKLKFVIIGGYAVSTYKHRFSIDADIVIKKEDKSKFESILLKNNFERIVVKILNHVYAPEFVRYEAKDKKDKLSVFVDLLIGGAGSRTTDASFSFEELERFSEERRIVGIEKKVVAMVPKKEIIIILKLHSGRLTDFRDIAALSKNINIELIKGIIWRGKKQIIKNNIKKVLALIDSKNFIDSFKGVFVEKKYDIDINEIKKLKQLLK